MEFVKIWYIVFSPNYFMKMYSHCRYRQLQLLYKVSHCLSMIGIPKLKVFRRPKICILYLYCDKRSDIQWNIAWNRGKCRGQSLWDFPRAQDIFYHIFWLKPQYRHSQLPLHHWPSLEIKFSRFDSPYCCDSWAIRENIA